MAPRMRRHPATARAIEGARLVLPPRAQRSTSLPSMRSFCTSICSASAGRGARIGEKGSVGRQHLASRPCTSSGHQAPRRIGQHQRLEPTLVAGKRQLVVQGGHGVVAAARTALVAARLRGLSGGGRHKRSLVNIDPRGQISVLRGPGHGRGSFRVTYSPSSKRAGSFFAWDVAELARRPPRRPSAWPPPCRASERSA